MKTFLFSLLFLFFSELSAQTCTPPPIRRLPVIDQDGIGTCASASGALLLQQNVENENGQLGLPRTPSYLQMSIYSAARSTEPGFFKREPESGRETFFNGFQNVCTVVDTAMSQGFCDSDNFPLDFLNDQDPMGSQQRSLEMIGRYLQANTQQLNALRNNLRDDPNRTKNLLAYLYQRQGNVCGSDPKIGIVRNVWLRRGAAWREQLSRTTNANQRRVLNTLISRTFGPDGQPTAAAMAFGLDALFERGMGAVTSPDRIATIGEGMLSVHWGIRLDLDQQGFLIDGTTDQAIQEDHRRTQYCEWPMLMAVQEYFSNPECQIPAGFTVPSELQNSVDAVQRIFTRQDLRASIVGLMAPACADQAQRRRINGLTCLENQVNSGNASQRKEEMFSELCAGRAVSVTVCRGFMDLTGPFNTQHCAQRAPGATGNDFHAMTALGFRNQGNRRQVFIQNSTGSRCSFADGNRLRAGFAGVAECELNSDGVPTGRFWIDEDLLMNNTVNLVTLKKN